MSAPPSPVVRTPPFEPVSGILSPTATYLRREWEWIPSAGALVISVTLGRRVIRTEIDHYRVREDRTECRPGIRSFLLENELDPDARGAFRCTIGPAFATCGCEAGSFDRRRARGTGCKHRDALRALLNQGVI